MQMPDPHTPQAAVGFSAESWINTGEPASTEPIPCAYTLEDMAADAIAILDFYRIEMAHVIGFAMGGQIAQVLAIQYPHRLRSVTCIMTAPLLLRAVHNRMRRDGSFVERLIAVAATLPVEGCSRAHYVHGQVAISRVLDVDPSYPALTSFKEQAVVRWATADFDRGGVDWDGSGEARQWLANAEWSRQNDAIHLERLRAVDVPVLVLHGTDDELVPIEEARALHQAIPHSRLVEYRGNHSLGNDEATAGLIAAAIVDHVNPL